MPVLFVYYVYDNPTYEVANKLICILYLDLRLSGYAHLNKIPKILDKFGSE